MNIDTRRLSSGISNVVFVFRWRLMTKDHRFVFHTWSVSANQSRGHAHCGY